MEDENKIELEKDNKNIDNIGRGTKSRRTIIVCLIVSCVLNIYLMYIFLHSLNFSQDGLKIRDIQKLNLFKSIMTNCYYKEINKEKLVESCIEGMTKLMDDPYTVYLKKEDMEDLKQKTEGNYKGIGISIKLGDDNLINIVDVFDNSPAKKAGIQIGDKILNINGKDITKIKDEQEYLNLMKDKDKEIDIKILRPSTNERISFKLKADNIKLVNVESKIFDNDIGYIKLKMFDNDVSKKFKEHLDKLTEKNIRGLLIDLRDNPGGDYKEVVNIASFLLSKDDLIVYTEDRNKKRTEEYAKGEGLDLPIGILVNGNSASASEVLSGALRDNNKAWLLGEKTYGKGLVQVVVNFKDGSGLKLTTAKYFTPSGECVQEKGLEPDYKVEVSKNEDNLVFRGLEDKDIQLKEALKIIRKDILD